MPVSVAILEDHPLERDGFRYVLAKSAGIHIVGVASNVPEFVELCVEEAPVVGLVDLMLSGCIENTRSGEEGPYGARVPRMLAEAGSAMRSIMVTIEATRLSVQIAVRDGFAGFVSKTEELSALAPAILEVAAGREHWPSYTVKHLRPSPLDETKIEILRALSIRSRSSDESEAEYICDRLHIGRSTFFRHREAILRHFGVANLTHAVMRAIRSATIPHPFDAHPGDDNSDRALA